MASNKIFRAGPVAIPSSAGNLLNCTVTTITGPVTFVMTQPYLIVRHIRIVNKSASAVPVSMYIGATAGSAAGTEFLGTALSIPANSAYDWYGALRLDAADFLTGVAGTVTTLVADFEGEVGLV